MNFSYFLADLKALAKGSEDMLDTAFHPLIEDIKKNIGPIGYALLQTAVAGAEITGGSWSVKLIAAIESATTLFNQKGLPIVLNDMVAGITAILNAHNAQPATAPQGQSGATNP